VAGGSAGRKFMASGNARAKATFRPDEFSLYSEVTVKDDAIRGYAKPLMRGVEVVHHQKVGAMQKIKEKLAGAASKVLKNRPRREVATVTDISGRIESPQTSIWQVITKLVQNAFFKAILPGFQRQAG
jgi:hypothetical protein